MRLYVVWPTQSGHPLADARAFLQRAVELEHATIPPYLTAMYSLVPGTNDNIAALLRSIVTEEMAHMTLAANILRAIGGTPSLTHAAFVPTYPGGLPYHIGGDAFEVSLAPFSLELVEQNFMTIEMPEGGALEFPDPGPDVQSDGRPHTVGAFYAKIRQLLERAGPGAFTGRAQDQLVQPYGTFVITSLDDALRAVDAIVRQGEGSRQSPLSGPAGELAHYYRFAEIVHGRTLVGDPNAPPLFFSYSGRSVPFDPAGVVPLVSNARGTMYAPGSLADRLSRQFNGQYGALLHLLEAAYHGRGGAAAYANIVGLMYDLKITAQRLIAVELSPEEPGAPQRFAAPTFEVTPSAGSGDPLCR